MTVSMMGEMNVSADMRARLQMISEAYRCEVLIQQEYFLRLFWFGGLHLASVFDTRPLRKEQ